MDAVFARVLELSQSGSIIVLAVLALRLILRSAPRRAVCLLWLLAVLRLLVPFEIQSSWSMQPEPVEFAPPVREELFDSGTAQTPVPPEFLEQAVEYPLTEQPEVREPADILPWVWLAGVGVLTVHGVVSYGKLKRRVRASVILEEGVWVCPGLDTAFVLGFFRPRIYLPVMGERERELVLLHERCHLRRLDHWWKPAAYAAVSVHWFNPLAWVTYVLLCRDMELACDQETVRGMDNAKRKAYSAALLNCAARRSGIAVCPVAFGEISVKERIKMVLNYKKPGFWVTLVALIAAITVGVCLMTSPKELTDLDRCEEALKQWQKMDAYRLRQSQSNAGEEVLNEWSVTDFWSCDAEHLMRFSYGEELGYWQHWKDGSTYIHQYGSEDAEWEDKGWRESESEEAEVIPWIMRLDWDELTVHSWEAADDGKTVLLTVEHPTQGPGTLSFHFDEDGELWSVARSFSQSGSLVSTGTIELVETDRTKIGEEMARFGVVPVLVRLYGELERIRGLEYIHLVTEIEGETAGPGSVSARQELIRGREHSYYHYELQGSEGKEAATALNYGGDIYVRQASTDMGWQRGASWEYGDIPLLQVDWTKLEASDLRQEPDGSTVITLQRDQPEVNGGNATIYSISCDFRLDPAGKLISLTYCDYCKVSGEDGVGAGPCRAVTYILDTPAVELEERIRETMTEVSEARAAAGERGI